MTQSAHKTPICTIHAIQFSETQLPEPLFDNITQNVENEQTTRHIRFCVLSQEEHKKLLLVKRREQLCSEIEMLHTHRADNISKAKEIENDRIRLSQEEEKVERLRQDIRSKEMMLEKNEIEVQNKEIAIEVEQRRIHLDEERLKEDCEILRVMEQMEREERFERLKMHSSLPDSHQIPVINQIHDRWYKRIKRSDEDVVLIPLRVFHKMLKMN
jgi:hypothetical protein